MPSCRSAPCAPLELLLEGGHDGLAVGGILLCLGFVAADDVAPPLGLHLLDEQLGEDAAALGKAGLVIERRVLRPLARQRPIEPGAVAVG